MISFSRILYNIPRHIRTSIKYNTQYNINPLISNILITQNYQKFYFSNEEEKNIINKTKELIDNGNHEPMEPPTDAIINEKTGKEEMIIPDNIQSIADEILDLNVIQMNLLFESLRQKLDMPDGFFEMGMASPGSGGGSGGDEAEEEEKEEEKLNFNIKLLSFDAKTKIKIIKEVRALTGLGLKDAKTLVEESPKTILKDVLKEDAENIKEKLVGLGAEIALE